MTIGEHRLPDLGMSPERRELLDRSLSTHGLDGDVINVWVTVGGMVELSKDPARVEKVKRILAAFKPRPHYAEGIRKNWPSPEWVDYIIQHSNQAKVVIYDALVDRFNGDLERIKHDNDFDALARFFAEAQSLIQ